MRRVGAVHAEIVAACPFSIADAYAADYLADARRGEGFLLHAGPLERRVRLRFKLQTDAAECGRRHDEILLRWTAGAKWLPDFNGTLRMRIHGYRTKLVLDGRYFPPGSIWGFAFDALLGRRIAAATARDFLRRIARTLEARELQWRAGVADSITPSDA